MEDNGAVRSGDVRETEGRVFQTVRAVVAEKLSRPEAGIPWDARLESELGVDSLVMIEINVLLEERFHFAMPDVAQPSELDVHTVRDLARFVAARLVEAPAARRA
jgi:acyl carrier protein